MQVPKEALEFVSKAKNRKDILAIYLFGSVARGRSGPASDIDICILPEKEGKSLSSVIDLGAKAHAKIDVVSFYRLPIQIRHRVFSEGTPLYEKDKGRVSRVIYETMHDYLDMKPGLDRICSAILKGRRKHG